jgi:hypothetical protein
MRSATQYLLILVTAVIAPVSLHSQMNQNSLLLTCKAEVSTRIEHWRMAPVQRDVAEWAKNEHENPVMVSGDFDGNGRKDLALLIQEGPGLSTGNPARLDSLRIAVCLDIKPAVKLYIIDKLYCGDGISLAKKGHKYHDFEQDTKGTFSEDGVSAYCFEKAGATYEFSKGSFHRIVDSD